MFRSKFFRMMLLVVVLGALAAISVLPAAADTTESILLFDARATELSGPITSYDQAVVFDDTTVELELDGVISAVIASTPDGTGEIVVDNFMLVNGVNVCPGNISTCFGGRIGPDNPGGPITDALSTIPPIDVTNELVDGPNTFELYDFGVILGNTDLYLVITREDAPAPSGQGCVRFTSQDPYLVTQWETPWLTVEFGNCGQEVLHNVDLYCEIGDGAGEIIQAYAWWPFNNVSFDADSAEWGPNIQDVIVGQFYNAALVVKPNEGHTDITCTMTGDNMAPASDTLTFGIR